AWEPVASVAVGVEGGSKGQAIEGAFHCRLSPRGELRTGFLWQGQKGPRDGLPGVRGPSPRHGGQARRQECRTETDLGSGFGIVELASRFLADHCVHSRPTRLEIVGIHPLGVGSAVTLAFLILSLIP